MNNHVHFTSAVRGFFLRICAWITMDNQNTQWLYYVKWRFKRSQNIQKKHLSRYQNYLIVAKKSTWIMVTMVTGTT